jgi:hypothetical protein
MLPGSELMRKSFFATPPKYEVFAVVGQVHLRTDWLSSSPRDKRTKGRRRQSPMDTQEFRWIEDSRILLKYKALSTALGVFIWKWVF